MSGRSTAVPITLWAVWYSTTYAVTPREAAELVLLLAAVVTACGVLWRAFRGFRVRLSQRLADWFDEANVRANAALIEELALIERRTRELVPNGGESVKDKVTRIELLYYSYAERSEAERVEMRKMLDELTARVEEIDP